MELSHMNTACLQEVEKLGHLATDSRGIRTKLENIQAGMQLAR